MKKPEGFTVFGNRVLVKANMEANEADGIIIPDTCLIHDWDAEVVQAGDKCVMVEVGDKIFYSKNESVTPFNEDGDFRLLKEDGVIARLVEDSITPLGNWILCKPDAAKHKVGNIYLPNNKAQKSFRAIVKRLGRYAAKQFHVGQEVYFLINNAVECFEHDVPMCLVTTGEILCTRG